MRTRLHFRMIVQGILDAIALPDYKPPLPHLDTETWDKIVDWNKYGKRNNFFEWMGDSLLNAAISVELCRQCPQGAEGVFTSVREGLAANRTFTHLTHKMGVLDNLQEWRERPFTCKSFADFFEVLAAEVYRKFGFEVLCDWVKDVFSPLITAALIAYKETLRPCYNPRFRRAIAGRIGLGLRHRHSNPTPRPLARKLNSLLRLQTPGAQQQRQQQQQPHPHPQYAANLRSQVQIGLPQANGTIANPPLIGTGVRPQVRAGSSILDPIVIDDDDNAHNPMVTNASSSGATLAALPGGGNLSLRPHCHSAEHEYILLGDD